MAARINRTVLPELLWFLGLVTVSLKTTEKRWTLIRNLKEERGCITQMEDSSRHTGPKLRKAILRKETLRCLSLMGLEKP